MGARIKRSLGVVALSLALSAVSGEGQFARVAFAADQLIPPQTALEKTLGAHRKQPVQKLDHQGLRIFLNEQVEGVRLEGWATRELTPAQTEALLAQFGVRTLVQADGEVKYFLAHAGAPGLGMALEADVHLRLDGKVYTGLTLKGYGGNTVHGEPLSPGGTLELIEALREMEMGNLLRELQIDTSLGVLAIRRPAASSVSNPSAIHSRANLVRLTRTSIRLSDLTEAHGERLRKLVDVATDLLKEELGKKLTSAEFAEWLVRETADVLARKDYLRFQHASVRASSLGLAEFLDVGLAQSGGAMKLPGQYVSQDFRSLLKEAHRGLSRLGPTVAGADFDTVFEAAYEARQRLLVEFDRARVNLSKATEAELLRIGFTAEEAVEVVKYNLNVAHGILDPMEIRGIKAITRDVSKMLERTTTDFLRLADGTQLGAYYVRQVGGAAGVRAILEETRTYLHRNRLSVARDLSGMLAGELPRVEAEIERITLARVRALGYERAIAANELTNLSKFIARQALELIVRR